VAIRVLDAAETMPGAAQLRQRSYDLLRLPRRATVVDVGCGTGRAVAELTEVAEPGAHAIGVDPDPAMLAAARSRFPDIDVRDADAAHLPLGEGEAHRYRADKVYHVLPDPNAALAEARRVLAPGGRIVLLGQDWDTRIIDSDQPELTRRIVHARADTLPHPRIARAYRNLLLDAGFHDVHLRSTPRCSPTPPCCPSSPGTPPPHARRVPSAASRPTTGSASRPGVRRTEGCWSPSQCSWPPRRAEPPATGPARTRCCANTKAL
jgi:SAM-dependent methyltransferase